MTPSMGIAISGAAIAAGFCAQGVRDLTGSYVFAFGVYCLTLIIGSNQLWNMLRQVFP